MTKISSIELVKGLENKWEKIAKSNPTIIGSSDITFFLCSLLNHGINCYYGPNLKTTLINTCDCYRDITIKYLLMALDDKKEYTINWASPELSAYDARPWTISSGNRTGKLIGDNLTTLADLFEHYPRYKLLPNGINNINDRNILLLEENQAEYYIMNEKVINSQLKN